MIGPLALETSPVVWKFSEKDLVLFMSPVTSSLLCAALVNITEEAVTITSKNTISFFMTYTPFFKKSSIKVPASWSSDSSFSRFRCLSNSPSQHDGTHKGSYGQKEKQEMKRHKPFSWLSPLYEPLSFCYWITVRKYTCSGGIARD
jgi:hypothetical protein